MSDPTLTDAEMTTDVPALLARADLVHLGRQVALVGDGDGFTTEVCGVKIAKCDDRGRTEADIRAEKAEAALAAAREALARVEALVEEYEQSDGTISHRLAGRRFRAALALTDDCPIHPLATDECGPQYAPHDTEMCVACDQPVDRVLPKPIPEGYDCMWSEAMCGRALYCQACFDDADPPTTTRPAAKERPFEVGDEEWG